MAGVVKKTLAEGSEDIYFEDGGKATLHIMASLADGTIVDDTRRAGWEPFELRLGKKFCMPALEEAVRMLKKQEVAEFELSADQAASYPQLSLVMRGKNKGRGQHSGVEGHDACDGGHSHGPHDTQRQCGGGDAADHHMCGLAASRANLKENADLYALLGKPMKLQLELVDYQAPGSFEREYWEVSLEDKLRDVPRLREEGNTLYRAGRAREAATVYARALSYLDRIKGEPSLLASPESQGAAQHALDLHTPLLLNMAACTLKLGDYPSTIDYCSQVLQADPDNPKALFRRAQAYAQQGRDIERAREDLERLVRADGGNAEAARELAKVKAKLKQAEDRERAAFSTLFAS